jgi:hypothetical protein
VDSWRIIDVGINTVKKITYSYVKREVPTVVEEEDDDVDEADILGLSNDDFMDQVVIKPGPIIKLTISIIRSC